MDTDVRSHSARGMTVTISSGGFRAKGQKRKWINAQHDSALKHTNSAKIAEKRKKKRKEKKKREFGWRTEFFPGAILTENPET